MDSTKFHRFDSQIWVGISSANSNLFRARTQQKLNEDDLMMHHILQAYKRDYFFSYEDNDAVNSTEHFLDFYKNDAVADCFFLSKILLTLQVQKDDNFCIHLLLLKNSLNLNGSEKYFFYSKRFQYEIFVFTIIIQTQPAKNLPMYENPFPYVSQLRIVQSVQWLTLFVFFVFIVLPYCQTLDIVFCESISKN